MFYILFINGTAQKEFARAVATQVMSLNPTPDDPSLLSFITSFFALYQVIHWKYRIRAKPIRFDPALLGNNGSFIKPHCDAKDEIPIVSTYWNKQPEQGPPVSNN